jgi:Uma2 family endonuclease
MEAVTTLPRGRPLTVADLDTMPDDGHRYELIEGALLVTPAPSVRHQIVCVELLSVLRDACSPHLRVLTAPLDVVLGESTAVQPDLLVARRQDFTAKNLPVAPLLAVEVLSPSTQLVDLNLKKAAYEQAGVASYWTVDSSVPRARRLGASGRRLRAGRGCGGRPGLDRAAAVRRHDRAG